MFFFQHPKRCQRLAKISKNYRLNIWFIRSTLYRSTLLKPHKVQRSWILTNKTGVICSPVHRKMESVSLQRACWVYYYCACDWLNFRTAAWCWALWKSQLCFRCIFNRFSWFTISYRIWKNNRDSHNVLKIANIEYGKWNFYSFWLNLANFKSYRIKNSVSKMEYGFCQFYWLHLWTHFVSHAAMYVFMALSRLFMYSRRVRQKETKVHSLCCMWMWISKWLFFHIAFNQDTVKIRGDDSPRVFFSFFFSFRQLTKETRAWLDL